jgi:hypothetical protein
MHDLAIIIERNQRAVVRARALALLDGDDARAARLAAVAVEAGPGFTPARLWSEETRAVAREHPGAAQRRAPRAL